MKARSLAIVGGGIAGLTLARFLVAEGHHVAVIERAKDFSAQGHSIGFRGIGLQVMELLGLRARVERTGRAIRATTICTMSGRRLRSIPQSLQAEAVGGVAITQRGLLHAALADDLSRQIDLRFGVQPINIRQTQDTVAIDLSDGSTLAADLLVGADGVNSSVRMKVRADIPVEDFGGIYVGMTIQGDHGLPVDEIAAYYGLARMLSFFPVDAHTMAVVLYQDDGYEAPPQTNSADAWAPYLQRVFKDAAPQVLRILAQLKPGDDIYHDRIRQVQPESVVDGRVALLGDAGFCPTFLSGNGAGLAAAAAWRLAKALRDTDDDFEALATYQARILPFAASYQANANSLRGVLFSRSRVRYLLWMLTIQLAPSFMVAWLARRHYRGEVRLMDLA